MRQVLDVHARRGAARVGIVLHQVAPAQLDRVHADPLGGEIEQRLARGDADRVADAAILRGRHAVQIDDPRHRPVVGVLVGPAGDIQDLVGLEHAGPRVLRVGADARQVVDLERGDLAVPGDRHARPDPVLPRMDVGDEGFEPVGDELDRPVERYGERAGRDLVAIGVDLEPERAADIGRDDADVVLVHRKVPREHGLDHVRHLAGGVDGEPLRALVPVREQRARLQADRGVAAELVGLLDRHRVLRGEGGVDVAVVDVAPPGEVVAEPGMQHRRPGAERGFLVDDDGKLLPLHLDKLGRVLGFRPGARADHRHRLALPARPVDRHRVLLGRLHPLEAGQHPRPGRAVLGELGAGHRPDDAGMRRRRSGIDPNDARVAVGAAHERRMHHARERDVVGIPPAPGHRAPRAGARQHPADIAVGTVEGGDRGRHGGLLLEIGNGRDATNNGRAWLCRVRLALSPADAGAPRARRGAGTRPCATSASADGAARW